MKTIFLLILTFILHCQYAAAQKATAIISKMTVSEDKVLNGVKGILVSFVYQFPDVAIDNPDLPLESKPKFKIATRIYANNQQLKTHKGWSTLSDSKGNFLLYTNFNKVHISSNQRSQVLEQFIPYAAFELTAGQQTISIESIFEGKDQKRNNYKQVLKKEKITINKPALRTFSFTVDSIEVHIVNRKGVSWDFSLIGNTAPDIEVKIIMGSTIVGHIKGNNSHTLTPSKSNKNTSFTISEADEVWIKIQDFDPTGSEDIAFFKLFTHNKCLGTTYLINTPQEHLKSCRLLYTVSNYTP